MKHLGTVKIDTARLILRRFTLEDADAMFRSWAHDAEVTRYLTWQPHESVDGTRAYLADVVSSYEKDDTYDWTIVPRELGEPIGSIGVVQRDDRVQMAHVGYCISRAWWRRGVTSEALGAVIRFFFEEVGVNRVESRHDPRNPNSGRVMLKCGMKYEGTRRQ
ncbi:MAG: GNAT family N-acetyltransferase, partial [Oscillospiraceae bacterium]|nr:GNAT family N-acetyltransferase [Oscillospiraceae bacterium]